MHRSLALFAASLLLMTAASAAHAASFDCKQRKLPAAQRMVCGDASLSTLDERMELHYRLALANAKDSAALKAEQQQWLRDTRDACTTPRCLHAVYETRIALLEDAGGPLLAMPGDYRRLPAGDATATPPGLRVSVLEDGRYHLQVLAADPAPRPEAAFVPLAGAARFSAGDCHMYLMFAPELIAVSDASPGCGGLDGNYRRGVPDAAGTR